MSDQPNDPAGEPTPTPRPLPPFEPAEVEAAISAAQPEQTNRKAIWSFAIGLLLVVPFDAIGLLGIIAITSGIHARREIRESQGHERGDALAQIGIALGVLSLAKVVLLTYLNY